MTWRTRSRILHGGAGGVGPRSWPTRVLGVVLVAACTAPGPGGGPGPPIPADTGSSPAPTSGSPSTPTGSMELSGPIPCAEPAPDAPGEYAHTRYGDGWPKDPDHGTPAWTLADGGRGVVVADFTGDGIADLLVPRDRFEARFLRGLGDGSFVEDPGRFAGSPPAGHQGGSAADIDGDGDLDAFLYGLMGDATLLWNEPDGLRAEDASAWDVGEAPFGCGGAAAWADVDRDGDLDLFYGRLGGSDPSTGEVFRCDSLLLLNDGSGGLAPSPDPLPAELQEIRVMAAGWYDFDGDGWLDLYAVSDAPPMRNLLLLNREGVLELSPPNGLQIVTAGMGLGVGDLNEDGLPDVTISGIRELPTALSEAGLGLWVESSRALELVPDGASGRTIAWSGDLVDLDADGWLDAVFPYGGVFGSSLPKAQPDQLYRNLGDGRFEPAGERWDWAALDVGRGAVAADLDGDGWLDLVKRELGGGLTVSLARCGAHGWLEVRLWDAARPNHAGVGALVRATVGERRLVRWVRAGSRGYASGGPPVVHFGLGPAEQVDELEVLWPTGEWVRYGPVAARQRVVVK